MDEKTDHDDQELEDDDDGLELLGPTVISCASQSALWGSAGLAFFWAALSVYATINFIGASPDWDRDGPILVGALLVFPGLAIFLLIKALFAARRYNRYGKSVFELAPSGAYLGESMKGLIRPSVVLSPNGPAELTLECRGTKVIRSAGKVRHETRSLWKESKKVPANTYHSSRTFPIDWKIPNPAALEAFSGEGRSIDWVLSLEVPTDGINFKAEFPIPVFTREETDDTA